MENAKPHIIPIPQQTQEITQQPQPVAPQTQHPKHYQSHASLQGLSKLQILRSIPENHQLTGGGDGSSQDSSN